MKYGKAQGPEKDVDKVSSFASISRMVDPMKEVTSPRLDENCEGQGPTIDKADGLVSPNTFDMHVEDDENDEGDTEGRIYTEEENFVNDVSPARPGYGKGDP